MRGLFVVHSCTLLWLKNCKVILTVRFVIRNPTNKKRILQCETMLNIPKHYCYCCVLAMEMRLKIWNNTSLMKHFYDERNVNSHSCKQKWTRIYIKKQGFKHGRFQSESHTPLHKRNSAEYYSLCAMTWSSAVVTQREIKVEKKRPLGA